MTKPEELKILDPACGSGHILVYAFDLLYAIYEEEGYQPSEIPSLILTHNLYGIEIDPRAGALSAFALTMKARAKYRRFLRKPVQPNICVLENVKFGVGSAKGVGSGKWQVGSKKGEIEELPLINAINSHSSSKNDPSQPPLISEESKTGVSSMKGEIEEYMDYVGRDLFTVSLQETLRQFEEVDNFGSLIRPQVTDVDSIRARLEQVDVAGNLLLYHTHEKVLKVLRQAEFLSPRYHVVIANPPYMGGKGMNPRLSAWVKDNYPDSKSDLFAMFIERNRELSVKNGYSAMITMQSWMFLSSFENLRSNLLNKTTILSMAHLGA
ncbi:Eco57I restriction-modification methylase domain-containing protein, partial [Geminocystis sp. CENA526]|uniref:Eco57I restriction-modification methylase domain-containing protein n=1 Tax=Geminocystis sp. CENA526 TaxID=1355871 RepID=UPI003D6F0117